MRISRLKWIPLFLAALSLLACASYRDRLAPAERVALGLLLDTTDGGPWGREGAALVERARAAGFEVMVRTAEGGGREVQERQARELIEAGAQLLLAVPSGPYPPIPIPPREHPLPVPMIVVGDPAPETDPVLFVGPDLEAAGYIQARTIRERIPGRGLVLLGGPEGDPRADRFRAGQLRALDEWKEIRGEATDLAADLRVEPFGFEGARSQTAALLDRPRRPRDALTAVLAFDDEAAGGAAAALAERDLSARVPVAGRGASLEACRRIISGEQLLTIYSPPEELAAAAVRAAIRFYREMEPGEIAVSLGLEDRSLEIDGREVPAVLLPPVPVTRGTMIETVILDGIHPIEAVYGTAGAE